MFYWIPFTFVRTVLVLIAGIVVAYYYPDAVSETVCLILIAAVLVLYFVVARVRTIRRRINPGWVALPLVFMLGYLHLLLRTESRREDHLLHNDESITKYRAVITRFSEERSKSWKTEARIEEVHTTIWKRFTGNIVLYFSKEDFPTPFEYGDVLLIKGEPELPAPAYNPGQFDYRRYLRLRNIYHQQFVRGGEVILLDHAPGNLLRKFAYKSRIWAEKKLRENIDGRREQAVASALVLGVTDGLDNELLDAYSSTGTMHILAVSGLHISVIYMILLRILKPLNRSRKGKWVIVMVSLGTLWLYALITGLSPSVFRAVMMFQFIALAGPWGRDTNIYNTLGVSAFCLLLYDPFLVFSVGFQLSYLAVWGIVFLYPEVLRMWQPNRVWLVELWKMTAVSISAQLATFPLGLLYFHQFPNYFLFSNLIVVPLSFVVLIAGLAIVIVSLVPFLAEALGFCLEWIVRFLNGVIFLMDDLPFAVTDHVYINALQAFLLIVLVALVFTLLEEKRFSYIIACLVVVVAFATLQWVHFFRDVNVTKLTVYHVPGYSAIDFINRGRTTFLADSVLNVDVHLVRSNITPHRVISGIMKEDFDPGAYEFQGGKLVVWQGRRLLQLTDEDYIIPEGFVVDWLVVGRNAVKDPGELVEKVQCKMIVLDSSNSIFFASRFIEEAKLYKLDVHSVLHKGAFIAEIENRDT